MSLRSQETRSRLRALLAWALIVAACSRGLAPVTSEYPVPADLHRVGDYPRRTESGGGYFYDEVLEYRVWVRPQEGSDHFHAFATYEEALAFSHEVQGAEEPLVLIRQLQWIDEPEPGRFLPMKGERLTEWPVKSLAGSLRGPTSIEEFLESHGRPAAQRPAAYHGKAARFGVLL
jgi:hypothetical protein